ASLDLAVGNPDRRRRIAAARRSQVRLGELLVRVLKGCEPVGLVLAVVGDDGEGLAQRLDLEGVDEFAQLRIGYVLDCDRVQGEGLRDLVPAGVREEEGGEACLLPGCSCPYMRTSLKRKKCRGLRSLRHTFCKSPSLIKYRLGMISSSLRS